MSEHYSGGEDRASAGEARLSDTWWELFSLKGVSYDLLPLGTDRFTALERAFEGLRHKEKVVREIRPANEDDALAVSEAQQSSGD